MNLPLTMSDTIHDLPPDLTLRFDRAWWREILGRVHHSYETAPEPREWVKQLGDGDLSCMSQGLRYWGPEKVLVIPKGELQCGRDIWFVGDVHGDLLGLEAVLGVIRYKSGPDAKIVFLGDLVDDGFHCAEVITRVLDLALGTEFEVSIVSGNHDEALRYESEERVFKSTVNPGEFAVWLNANPGWHDLARAYINLTAALPRALFFEHGLFASHAGFPHSDTWDRVEDAGGPVALADSQMLKDFTWNRLSESKRKRPNRGSLGSSFGSEDFAGFREAAERALHFPIEWMVRGHDHISDKLRRFSRPLHNRRWAYDGRILTVNNMCYTLPRETGLDFGEIGFARQPTLAKWEVEFDAPTPVALEIPDESLAEYMTRCPACHRAVPVFARGFNHECHAKDGVA